MKEDFAKNGGYFVPIEAFHKCLPTILEWIDIPSLTPYLMSHHLVTSKNDLYCIGERFSPNDRIHKLVTEITPKAGMYGSHLLYMCIRSATENLGHMDAAEELKKHSMF